MIIILGLFAGVVVVGIGIAIVVLVSSGPRSLAPSASREPPSAERSAPLTAERARQLASAIVADIRLYNAEKIAQASDVRQGLATEIEEGRSLFRSRAPAEHHALYEAAIDELARR